MQSESPRVLGVLAGSDVAPNTLADWAGTADVVLAADGAANALLAAGVAPDVTIGDLDSLGARDGLAEVVEDRDQSTSDADKLLAFAWSEGYRAITLIGVEGDRLDHVLASLASAARSPLSVRLILRSGVGWIVRPGQPANMSTAAEDLVSFLPLQACTGVLLAGVRWPLEDATLSATGLVSLSNRATGTSVRASIATGAALLVRVALGPEEPAWEP